MTTPAEYVASMEDTIDSQAVTIALLLEEIAELAVIADQVTELGRWLRVERAAALDKHRLGQARGLTRAIAFGDVISRYEQMEGSS